jgi:triacylglycerol lipase
MKRMLASLALGLGALSVTAPALAISDYAKTKYPIVFVHGLSGFKNIGPMEYWNGIPADLNANGATTFVTQVAPFQSSEVRGEQLLTQVQEILAITGAAKVNLIGHSHGGPTIRYVGGVFPTKVASLTTVGGVNRGSAFADILLSASSLPVVGAPGTDLITSLVNGFGGFLGLVSGQSFDSDSYAALTSLSTAGSMAFNAKFPEGIPVTACGEGAYTGNGIRNYSWSGTGVLTNPLDPLDVMFGLTSLAFVGQTDWQNDGMVGRCSSHFGKVVRDNYFMNHTDEVNLFGLVSIFETNPKTVYRQHANRLKLAGL